MVKILFAALFLAGCSINHRVGKPMPLPSEIAEAEWSPWVLKETESGPDWSRKVKCRYVKREGWHLIQCVSDYEKTTTVY